MSSYDTKDETYVLTINFKKMDGLIFYGEVKEFYPYRTARCNHSMFVELSKDQLQDLREYLGQKMDNHITWKSGKLYFTYSDNMLMIGTSVTIKNW